jgi:hypothetical protein
MATARKLFRLFKWIIEYQKISKLVKNHPADGEPIDLALAVLTRLGFFGFWWFDNLWVCAHVGLLKRDKTPLKKPGMLSWFFALIFSILAQIRKLGKINADKASILKVIRDAPGKKEKFQEKLNSLDKAKFTCYKTLVKNFSDMITASAASGMAEKVGIKWSDAAIGFGGSLSALLTCYDLYPKK